MKKKKTEKQKLFSPRQFAETSLPVVWTCAVACFHLVMPLTQSSQRHVSMLHPPCTRGALTYCPHHPTHCTVCCTSTFVVNGCICVVCCKTWFIFTDSRVHDVQRLANENFNDVQMFPTFSCSWHIHYNDKNKVTFIYIYSLAFWNILNPRNSSGIPRVNKNVDNWLHLPLL